MSAPVLPVAIAPIAAAPVVVAPVAKPVVVVAVAPIAVAHFDKLKHKKDKLVAKGGSLGKHGKVKVKMKKGEIKKVHTNKALRKAVQQGKVSEATVQAAIAAAKAQKVSKK